MFFLIITFPLHGANFSKTAHENKQSNYILIQPQSKSENHINSNPVEHMSNALTLSCQNNYKQKLSGAIHNGLVSIAVVYLKGINYYIYSFYCDIVEPAMHR